MRPNWPATSAAESWMLPCRARRPQADGSERGQECSMTCDGLVAAGGGGGGGMLLQGPERRLLGQLLSGRCAG
jgi:hypothetical protein